uniref:Zinc finger (CCCH type) motif-containing protein n=1 Tax=Toxoplasma gondii COUG TaxID=1074873 RepID=A0A2G8Y9W2_TOXGO|nr:zinc finger (CCCH type) motif-containing protein [Toxoplasma gondii COUG]
MPKALCGIPSSVETAFRVSPGDIGDLCSANNRRGGSLANGDTGPEKTPESIRPRLTARRKPRKPTSQKGAHTPNAPWGTSSRMDWSTKRRHRKDDYLRASIKNCSGNGVLSTADRGSDDANSLLFPLSAFPPLCLTAGAQVNSTSDFHAYSALDTSGTRANIDFQQPYSALPAPWLAPDHGVRRASREAQRDGECISCQSECDGSVVQESMSRSDSAFFSPARTFTRCTSHYSSAQTSSVSCGRIPWAHAHAKISSQRISNDVGEVSGIGKLQLTIVADRRSAFVKTQMCQHVTTGRCRMGELCRYAHSEAELRPAPQLDKTTMCASVKAGKLCPRGDACTFAHSRGELRQTINHYKTNMCRNWLSGRCTKSNTCNHAHGEQELSFYRRLAATTGRRNFTEEQQCPRFDPVGTTACDRVAFTVTDSLSVASTSPQGGRVLDSITQVMPLSVHHCGLGFHNRPGLRFYSGTNGHDRLQIQSKAKEASASDSGTSCSNYPGNKEPCVTESTPGCMPFEHGRSSNGNALMQAKTIEPHNYTRGQMKTQSLWSPHGWPPVETADMGADFTDESGIDRYILGSPTFARTREDCGQQPKHLGRFDVFETGDPAKQLDHQRQVGTHIHDSGRLLSRLMGLTFAERERHEAQKISSTLPFRSQEVDETTAMSLRHGCNTVATNGGHIGFFFSGADVFPAFPPATPTSLAGVADSSSCCRSSGTQSFGSPSTFSTASAPPLAGPQRSESWEIKHSPWKQTWNRNAGLANKNAFSHVDSIAQRSHGWRPLRGFVMDRPGKDNCVQCWTSVTLPQTDDQLVQDKEPRLSFPDQTLSSQRRTQSCCHTFGAPVWKSSTKFRRDSHAMELPGPSRATDRSVRFYASASTTATDSVKTSAITSSSGILDRLQQVKLQKHVERLRWLQQQNRRSGEIVFWGAENLWGYSTAEQGDEGQLASCGFCQPIVNVGMTSGAALSRRGASGKPHAAVGRELQTWSTWSGHQSERERGLSSLTELVAFLLKDGVCSCGKETSLNSVSPAVGVTEGVEHYQSSSVSGNNGSDCQRGLPVHESYTQGYALESSNHVGERKNGTRRTKTEEWEDPETFVFGNWQPRRHHAGSVQRTAG